MRYTFPEEGDRLVYAYQTLPYTPLGLGKGTQFRVTTDQAGLVAADTTDLAGVAYAALRDEAWGCVAVRSRS